MNLYVYYDVDASDGPALVRTVRAMQAELQERCGIVGRLMKRPPEGGARETWMEIYEGVDAPFEAALERAASAVAWGSAGPRHVERFVDC